MPNVSSVSPTNNPYVNGILSGVKWAVNSLTYSFPTDPSFYGSYGSEPSTGFEAFTALQASATRAVLAQYSSVINFTFTEVTESSTVHGDIRFAESEAPSTAWAYYPGVSQTAGDIWFNNSKNWYDNPVQGNYAYSTILHELGHALGLKHPHSASSTFGTVPLDRDAVEYTVMSYRSYVGGGTSGLTNDSTSYPQTLMMYDIAALQEMYGANFNTNSGDTVYRWDPNTGRMYVDDVQATSPGGNKILLTVWDGGGRDTYDFSNYSANLTVNLNPGAWSTVSTAQLADLGNGKKPAGNIANALQYNGSTASLIEDAIGGSGNDGITGNTANNKLTGGAGNDTLDGGVGEDTACYAGTFSNYAIVYNLDTSWTITDMRSLCPDGIDVLWNFEWLQFYDVTVSLDSSIFEPTLSAPAIAALLNDSEITTDRITKNAALVLNGTAAASTTIKIYSGIVLLGTTTADANGLWTVSTSALADGQYQLTATATDGSGTTSSHSTQFLVLVDTSAPQIPQITAFSPDSNAQGDRITNINNITLTGTAEANSQVHIYDGQTLLGVTTAGQNGQWTFDTSGNAASFAMGCGCAECAAARDESEGFGTLSDGDHAFTALSKDVAGNTSGSSAAFLVKIDTSAPNAPVIAGFSPDTNVSGDGITSANQLTLTGTAAAGSTVKVYDGASLIKTLVADNNGAWSFTTSTLTNATHSFTATATDAAGNTSGSSSALQVTVDTVAPGVPVITGFSPDTNVAGDGITSANQLTLTGTAAAGSTVKVYDGASLIKTLVADNNGAWSFTTSTLTNATHSFTATATDAAGNTSGSSSALQVTVDTVTPNAPVIAGFSPDTNVSGDGITSANQLTLTGTAAAGSTVKVYDGASLIKTVIADNNGAWSFTTSTLTNATHSFTATATDAAGNTSGTSTALQVTVDTVAPGVPVISGFSPDTNVSGDGITSANQLSLTGTAAAGSTVKVYDGASLIKTVIADNNGAWSFTTSTLTNATHSFTATATDAAGNTSGSSPALQVTVDTVAPGVPVITGFSPDSNVAGDGITSANQLTLTGTAAAGTTVKVYDGATLITTLVADNNGAWSFTTSTLTNATHSFTATATDAAGNTSGSSSALQVTVESSVLAPTIDGFSPDSYLQGDGVTNANRLTLTGSADPGTEVSVYDGGVFLGRVIANNAGEWSFITSTLSNGEHAFSTTGYHLLSGTSPASDSLTVLVDTIAPTGPTIGALSVDEQSVSGGVTNSNAVTLNGTAEAGSLVTVTDGKVVIGTATADAQGAWSFTAASLAEGAHSFSVRSTDTAGNQSVVSTAVGVKVDTLAPGNPKIARYSTDSGILGDGITNATSIKLTGAAEAFAKVKIYDGNMMIGETVATNKGAWSFTTGTLEHGASFDFKVTATDAALNTSATSNSLAITVDNVAPSMPQILSYSPGNQALGLTKSSVITLTGAAEAGSTIKLYNGSKYVGATIADDQGGWSFTTSPLANATYRFAATATDAAGNVSPLATLANGSVQAAPTEDHAVLVVTVDTKAPGRPVVSSFSNDTGRVGDRITSDSTLDFSGRAEAGSTVDVYAGDMLLGSTAAGSNGTWNFLTDQLQDGAYNFIFKATDLAGNTSGSSRPLQLTVDTQIAAPSILEVSPDTGVAADFHTKAKVLTLKGEAEAFSQVMVLSGETLLGAVKASASGTWTFKTKKLPDGEYNLSVTAVDRAGNVSDTSSPIKVIVDTVAPKAPIISNHSVIGDTVSFVGTAEANDFITLYDGKAALGTVSADASGNWSFYASGLSATKHNFSAVASDLADNTSKSQTLIVTILAQTQYGPEAGLTDSALPISLETSQLSGGLHEAVSLGDGSINLALNWYNTFQLDDSGALPAVQPIDWHIELQQHHGYVL